MEGFRLVDPASEEVVHSNDLNLSFRESNQSGGDLSERRERLEDPFRGLSFRVGEGQELDSKSKGVHGKETELSGERWEGRVQGDEDGLVDLEGDGRFETGETVKFVTETGRVNSLLDDGVSKSKGLREMIRRKLSDERERWRS